MAANLYTYQASNVRRTWLLFIVFFLVFGALGYAISAYYGDPSYLIFAFIFSVIYSFISYYASGRISLSLAKTQEIQKSDNPILWNVVENLTIAAGLPMPKLY